MVEKTKVRIICIGGRGFIATPEGQKLLNAMKTDYDKPDLKEYFKKNNVGELETVTLGVGIETVSRELRPEESLQWDVYAVKLAQIKSYAVGKLENDLFDKSF